jgi:hypothetical protein
MNSTRLSVVLGSLATAYLVGATEALAQVCDKGKGGDSWMLEHGAVWLLNPVGWPLGLIALLAWLLLAARGSKWFGYVGAALLVTWIATDVLIDLVPQHDVYRMQIKEGCRSVATDWADIGVLALFASAYGWLGLRRHRIEVKRIVAARRDEAAAQNV